MDAGIPTQYIAFRNATISRINLYDLPFVLMSILP